MSQASDNEVPHEAEKNLVRFMQLIGTKKINVMDFQARLEKQQISSRDRHYLGLIIGLLNKLFGEQTVLSRKIITQMTINQSPHVLFESYESNLSADALAAHFQPTIDALMLYSSLDEKNRLLTHIEAISSVLEDSKSVARLALLWQCIHAVDTHKTHRILPLPTKHRAWQLPVTASKMLGQKKLALPLLIDYRKHLYRELRKAWPLHYYISTNLSGQVFILTRQGVSISEKNMTKNALLLKQKCQSINTALIMLQDKKTTLTIFKHHFNQRIRPVINQYRTQTDYAFLADMQKLLTRFVGFFLPVLKVKGERVSENVAHIQAAPEPVDKRMSLAHG